MASSLDRHALMLREALTFSAIAIGGAIYFAGGNLTELMRAASEPDAPPIAAKAEPGKPQSTQRSARIRGDSTGHFVANFSINGRSVRGVVDTGASAIAINRSTAKRIGLSVSPADFTYPVSTANGQTYAAAVMIDKVEIGGIKVRDVQAMVLEDSALSMTLIGMTFLKKTQFTVVDNTLSISQR